MKIIVIDNYDSFTYNLVQILRKHTNEEPVVKRNDEIEIPEIGAYDKILLSPGPGIPEEAGKLMEVIREYGSRKSILGICLGHQAIARCFGAKLVNLREVYHGLATGIRILGAPSLFRGLPENITAGRYHSWVVDRESLPGTLKIAAEDDSGHIMALQHTQYDLWGVQFHPESILTGTGEAIIANWLDSNVHPVKKDLFFDTSRP